MRQISSRRSDHVPLLVSHSVTDALASYPGRISLLPCSVGTRLQVLILRPYILLQVETACGETRNTINSFIFFVVVLFCCCFVLLLFCFVLFCFVFCCLTIKMHEKINTTCVQHTQKVMSGDGCPNVVAQCQNMGGILSCRILTKIPK